MMSVASCIPFLFSALCDDMLTMLVCATCWLYMHLYMLAYMSMHESYLLVCRPWSNTMKLWISDSNLHLSLADTSFCLLSRFFALLLVCLLPCFFACHSYHAYPFYAFSYAFHTFSFHCLSASFLVFTFACTHIERGRMELGHGLLGISKKSVGASMSI